jgi:hypothetical protein
VTLDFGLSVALWATDHASTEIGFSNVSLSAVTQFTKVLPDWLVLSGFPTKSLYQYFVLQACSVEFLLSQSKLH